MRLTLLTLCLLLMGASCQNEEKTHHQVQAREVRYQVDGKEFVGYYAHPKNVSGKVPGVLVVHEWWGHNDYARKRTEKLAKEGYAAFALDMYGGGKSVSHPKKAGQMSAQVKKNMPQATKRFRSAMETLKGQKQVDKEKIGAIGYCFGGGIVLEMARRGLDLDAVASFHGSLGTDSSRAKKGEIKAKILVANGADDPFVKPEHIENLKEEMRKADVDFRFMNFQGAKHSFTNPKADKFGKKFDLPLEYNKKADKKSWKAMLDLFNDSF